MAAEREQELREFTRRLFQDSRDPSAGLTPEAVRCRFVAQSGRGSLTPGEKRLLQHLVEAELRTQGEKPRGAAEHKSSASPSPSPPPESGSDSDDSDREAKSPETKKLRAEDLGSPEAKKPSPRPTEAKKPRARAAKSPEAKKIKANSTESPEASLPEGEASVGDKEQEASAEDSSSSFSSSDEENTHPQENTRSHSTAGAKKQKGRLQTGKQEPGDAPEVRRLKRYLRVCGVRPNYRKLLGGCRSRRERVAVLRQELAALGLDGRPSLQRCEEVRLRREQEAEVAALDLSNIIPSHGRPRRHNVWSLYATPSTPPASSPPRARPDWSRLRGIISSDEDNSE